MADEAGNSGGPASSAAGTTGAGQASAPDVTALTAQITALQAEKAALAKQVADKDTFITGAAEFSLDYQVRKIHPRTQEPLPNIVYLVINTPPHDGVLPVHVTYRAITPDIDFHSRQPVVDGTPGFEGSLRGHRQYLNASRTFRGAPLPHTLPISLFSEPIDLSVQPAGITRSSELDLWTTVPPFVPVVLEHDILVRAANDAHYEVTSTVFDWGLIDPADLTKPRLKSQQFHGKLLEQNDPKSKIPVRKT